MDAQIADAPTTADSQTDAAAVGDILAPCVPSPCHVCLPQPATQADGTPCDDGHTCTENGQCSDGVCQGSASIWAHAGGPEAAGPVVGLVATADGGMTALTTRRQALDGAGTAPVPWLRHYDAQDNLVWQKTYVMGASQVPKDLVLLPDGGYAIGVMRIVGEFVAPGWLRLAADGTLVDSHVLDKAEAVLLDHVAVRSDGGLAFSGRRYLGEKKSAWLALATLDGKLVTSLDVPAKVVQQTCVAAGPNGGAWFVFPDEDDFKIKTLARLVDVSGQAKPTIELAASFYPVCARAGVDSAWVAGTSWLARLGSDGKLIETWPAGAEAITPLADGGCWAARKGEAQELTAAGKLKAAQPMPDLEGRQAIRHLDGTWTVAPIYGGAAALLDVTGSGDWAQQADARLRRVDATGHTSWSDELGGGAFDLALDATLLDDGGVATLQLVVPTFDLMTKIRDTKIDRLDMHGNVVWSELRKDLWPLGLVRIPGGVCVHGARPVGEKQAVAVVACWDLKGKAKWQVDIGAPYPRYSPPDGGVTAAAVWPDGHMVAFGSDGIGQACGKVPPWRALVSPDGKVGPQETLPVASLCTGTLAAMPLADGSVVITRRTAGMVQVQRLEVDGTMLWKTGGDATHFKYLTGLDRTLGGDILAVGRTDDSQLGAVRLSPSGIVLWARKFDVGGDSLFDRVGVTRLADGTFLLTGAVRFGIFSARAASLMRFDQDGRLINARIERGFSDPVWYGAVPLPDGGAIVVGRHDFSSRIARIDRFGHSSCEPACRLETCSDGDSCTPDGCDASGCNHAPVGFAACLIGTCAACP